MTDTVQKPEVNFQSLKKDITNKASLVAGNLTQQSTEIEIDALRTTVADAFEKELITKSEKVKLTDLINLCFDVEPRSVGRVSEQAQQELDKITDALQNLRQSWSETEAIEHMLRGKGHELQMNARLIMFVPSHPWYGEGRHSGKAFHSAADVLKSLRGEHVAALLASYSRLREDRDELTSLQKKNRKLEERLNEQAEELRKLRNGPAKKAGRAVARTQ